MEILWHFSYLHHVAGVSDLAFSTNCFGAHIPSRLFVNFISRIALSDFFQREKMVSMAKMARMENKETRFVSFL